MNLLKIADLFNAILKLPALVRILSEQLQDSRKNYAELIAIIKRSYPVAGDKPFFEPVEVTVAANSKGEAKFSIPVPRNSIYYLKEVGYTYYEDSEYRLSADGGALMVNKLTFNPQAGTIIFVPPHEVLKHMCMNLKNNSAKSRSYKIYYFGWKRLK